MRISGVFSMPFGFIYHAINLQSWSGIRGTQVKSSGNKNWMSPSRSSDGANFSETPPSWHVRPIFSFVAIVNY